MILEIILLFFTSLLLHYLIFNGRRKSKRLPPGPTVWPVLGNVVNIAVNDPDYTYLALAKMAEKHGPLMGLGFGVHYAVVISSYELMKEILPKPEASGRFGLPFVPDRAFGKRNMGIIFNNGDSYKELKNFTVRTLRDFGFSRTNAMEGIVQDEALDMANRIKEIAASNNGVFAVDAVDLQTHAVNIIWGLVAGMRFSQDDPVIRKTVALNDELMQCFGYTNLYSPFPFLKTLFPEWSGYKRHLKVYDTIQTFLKEIIQKIKKRGEAANYDSNDSFVQCFLKEIEARKGTGDENYTEEQLVTILSDLFLAGAETTGITTMWMILYLSYNPQVQEKVFKEVMDVVGPTEHVSPSYESRLPYTKATILEVQRMANVLSLNGQREALKDIEVGEYVIPKGALILFNLHPFFTDKGFWGDPEVFRPERFLKKDDATGELKLDERKTERIIPFGVGRRQCMGDTTAQMSLFVFLPTLVRSVKFSTIPGKEPCTQPRPKSVSEAPFPFSVNITVR